MRSIVIAVITLCFIGVAPQIARATHFFIVEEWPQDIAKVPCTAFKKNSNGTWKEVAIFILHGNRFTGNTYSQSSPAAVMLDRKCGAGAR
jgi:hypothetical protein